eukprot:733332-Alexandrium_andersonii.AAC.1
MSVKPSLFRKSTPKTHSSAFRGTDCASAATGFCVLGLCSGGEAGDGSAGVAGAWVAMAALTGWLCWPLELLRSRQQSWL